MLNCEEGGPDGGTKLWSGVGFIDLVLRRDVFATCLDDEDALDVGNGKSDVVGGTPCEDACEIGV